MQCWKVMPGRPVQALPLQAAPTAGVFARGVEHVVGSGNIGVEGLRLPFQSIGEGYGIAYKVPAVLAWGADGLVVIV
jgi:hypothetical protein